MREEEGHQKEEKTKETEEYKRRGCPGEEGDIVANFKNVVHIKGGGKEDREDQIFTKMEVGNVTTITMEKNMKIIKVKQGIQKKENIAIRAQSIQYAGKKLPNEETLDILKTLEVNFEC